MSKVTDMLQSAVVDLYLLEYPNYFQIPNFSVKYLIVDSETERERVTSDYPDVCVYLASEVCSWDTTYVSKKEITDYLPAQLKVYRHAVRAISNQIYDSKIESMYYSSLAFWIYHLQNGVNIFMQFGLMEHGEFTDSIPFAVAKKLGIPALSTDLVVVGKSGYRFFAVKNHVTEEYIDLTNACNREELVNFRELMFHPITCSQLPESKTSSNYPKWVRKLYYHCLNSKLSPIAFISGKLTGTNEFSIRGIPFKLKYKDYLHFKSYMRSLKRYYVNHSIGDISPDKKSILYAMHFEPEASILNRTIYNSQLYNIQMLASSLPKDWILYVKDHPDTFRVSMKTAYFMPTMPYYRNKQYYADLLSIPNVKLLSIDLNSHHLLSPECPQIKAVATINGTITVEAMEEKKPVLLFDSATVPYTDVDDLQFISSENDLKDAMSRLVSGFQPKYDGYDMLISRYLCLSKHDSNVIDLPPEQLSDIIKHVISLSNKEREEN